MKRKCAASDCENNIDGMMPYALYCSHKCRWREHKRKTYKERFKNGKCPQCGGEINHTDNNPSYCRKCQKYYHERYKKINQ